MLLISAAFAFSASAAEGDKLDAYAEAQFVAGFGALGGALIDPLGDGLENQGTQACAPQAGECDPGPNYSESPLQPLEGLTVPPGDALGGEVGAAGNYAKAEGDGDALAASGAVTREGIIQVGGQDVPPAQAKFALSEGALSDLAEIADVRLDAGAVSATAELAASGVTRDYNIADAKLILDVPALESINTALGGAVTGSLADPVTLNATAVCTLLVSLGEDLTAPAPGSLPGVPDVSVCENVGLFDTVLSGKITGLSAATDGLENVTKDGVTFDFTTGEVTVDLNEAVKAAFGGKNINELPANTEILKEILPALALNLDDLIGDVYDDLVVQIVNNVKLEATLNGTALPPFELSDLGEAGFNDVLGTVFGGLEDGLNQAGQPLADGLEALIDGLGPILKLIVNVPDEYADLIDGDREGGINISRNAASETALRVQVGPEGQAADLFLANALVDGNAAEGPGGAADADGADADGADADGADADGADADVNSNADVTDADADADANAQADADVTTTATLPAAGAPNMLPLGILALALLGLGGGILLNEKRRRMGAE